MAGTTRKAGGFTPPDADAGWVEHRGDTYRYEVHRTTEAGRFSAVAATVPGVAGAGATEAGALAAVRDGLAAALRAAKAAGQPVPRVERTTPPAALSRWVIVRLAE